MGCSGAVDAGAGGAFAIVDGSSSRGRGHGLEVPHGCVARVHQHGRPSAATQGARSNHKNLREEPLDHGIGRSRGGLTSKVHLVCDGRGRPLGWVITGGNINDTTMMVATTIPEGDDQIGHRRKKPGRPIEFGDEQKERYRGRNVVERCFNKLEQWRGIAMRSDKIAPRLACRDHPRRHADMDQHRLDSRGPADHFERPLLGRRRLEPLEVLRRRLLSERPIVRPPAVSVTDPT